MTVDLTTEELQRILLALKEDIRRRKADGLSPFQEEQLVARLEVVEREQGRTREPTGIRGS